MKLGNSAALTRVYNRSVVLDALRRQQGLSRVELARLSGLTPQAIRNIVADLLEDGLVEERGRRKGLRGQPQIEIAINPDGGYALGFHIVGRECRFMGANLAGEVVVEGGAFSLSGAASSLAGTLERIDRSAAQGTRGKLRLGVGIAVSSPMATNWTKGPLAEFQDHVATIREYFGADVWIENDANAAAMAEAMFGIAKEHNDFIYLFVGEDTGGAIVRGGELQRGHRGNAGEFGHLLIDPNGPKCHCGNNGCLNTYLSASDAMKRFTGAGEGANDATVGDWLASAVPALRRAIVSLENAFDPDRIILGGTAPVALLEILVKNLPDLAPSVRSQIAGPRIEVSHLGPTSALMGACALPILNLMSPSKEKLTKQSRA